MKKISSKKKKVVFIACKQRLKCSFHLASAEEKNWVFLCYLLPLKENPHEKGAPQEKETEN